MTVDIRASIPSDDDAIVALWRTAGLTRPWNDPHKDIARHRAVWARLLLVAVDSGAIVGAVMVGYDGHRGWLYYLASAPDHRGEGIGGRLVTAAEDELVALGCPKVQLMVRPGNEQVLGFYDRAGYERLEIAVTGKRLITD